MNRFSIFLKLLLLFSFAALAMWCTVAGLFLSLYGEGNALYYIFAVCFILGILWMDAGDPKNG